ncbi:ISL3 family transposase [Micromonospora sp. NPDC048830]|uniref:ISL3 family transposase n=1 Tax=Micromonospora sp. NPDC048830 TaxID=3364257 RepID=UPI003715E170
MELLAVFFPHLAGLRITNVLAKGSTVRVHAETNSAAARCPACSSVSRRVHSRYERRLLDGAVAGRETVLHLRVRRFFCTFAGCVRRIFAEQVDGLTVRHGRHSALARRMLEAVALALGGRAGARLTGRLGPQVGRMTLLRLVRALPEPPTPAPVVLGVDDFAWRRGHTYGTVLVNMATHQVIDVLDDRSADSLAAWLNAHPGIEVICRDRAGCYAEGAARGAPAAIQVADRWHLLHNLSDAVNKAVAHHRRCLQPPPEAPAQANPTPAAVPAAPDGLRVQRTRARHAEVHALREQGLGVYTIARRLGLDPKTVRRYAGAADPETLLGPNGTVRDSILDPFKPYLQQRCAEGVPGTNQLLAEIRARGYKGGERTLRRYLISIRGRNEPAPVPPPAPPTRDITGWIMRPVDKLTDEHQAELERLCGLCPDLAAIRDLARGFTDLVRTRGGERLTAWVEQAEQGKIAEIRSFASGLRKDWDAVKAGLSMVWSSGAAEGAVNRIKMLKRQMYGRANHDLLRRRILLAD